MSDDENIDFVAPPPLDSLHLHKNGGAIKESYNSEINEEPQGESNVNELNEDVTSFRVAFLNEMNSPELLPYEEELVEDLLEQIRNQQENVDEIAADVENGSEEKTFSCHLYQMEIDRIKYMMASYLRSRLRKIESNPLHYLRDPTIRERLGANEHKFLNRYTDLMEGHVTEIALRHLPSDYQSLDAEDMITSPNVDSFVFCETIENDVGSVQCDDAGLEEISMELGDRHVVRYRVIQELVQDQKVKLI